MDNVDLEFQNMLRQGAEKKEEYSWSVEIERRKLVDSFYAHRQSLDSFYGFGTSDDGWSGQDDEIVMLEELVQADVIGYEMPQHGDMEVSGNGTYMFDTIEATTLVSSLSDGETIRGEIDRYAVAPMIKINEDGRDTSELAPVPWVLLKNAVVRTADGEPIETCENVLVPLTESELHFDHIRRVGDELKNSEVVGDFEVQGLIETEEIVVAVGIEDVTYDFRSHDLEQLRNDIEADLNYNEFTADELLQARREYQAELNGVMRDVITDDKLIVSINDAQIVTGGTTDLIGKDVYYNGPTIIHVYDIWRVMHGFTVLDENGEESQLVHAFAQSIQFAFRNTSK